MVATTSQRPGTARYCAVVAPRCRPPRNARRVLLVGIATAHGGILPCAVSWPLVTNQGQLAVCLRHWKLARARPASDPSVYAAVVRATPVLDVSDPKLVVHRSN